MTEPRTAHPPEAASEPPPGVGLLQESHLHATRPQESGFPATPGGARPRGDARDGVRRVLLAAVPPLVLVAAGLVAWQWFVTASGVRPQVLPSPLRVAEQGWAAREQIWANTLPTLQVTAVGFAVSLAIGWAIAIAVDFSPWLRRALTPLLVASQTLPIIAIAPVTA